MWNYGHPSREMVTRDRLGKGILAVILNEYFVSILT